MDEWKIIFYFKTKAHKFGLVSIKRLHKCLSQSKIVTFFSEQMIFVTKFDGCGNFNVRLINFLGQYALSMPG